LNQQLFQNIARELSNLLGFPDFYNNFRNKPVFYCSCPQTSCGILCLKILKKVSFYEYGLEETNRQARFQATRESDTGTS